MTAQKASVPVKLVRFAVAAVMIVLAGAVVLRLAGRRGDGPRRAAVKAPPEGRVVDLKERVRHKEYRDGKLRAEIRGDSFFLGPDGRNHLKGSVEVTDYGPAGEVVSRTTADEVVYDTGSSHFSLSGRARIETGGVVLEGGSFEYDKDGGLFRTTSGGAFSSDRMSGTAAEISYSENAGEVRLDGGFRVEIGAARSGGKIGLSGDSFLYQRRERKGRAEGRPGFSGEACRGSARVLSFDASEDESYLKSVTFDGSAEVVLSGNGPGRGGSGGIQADRVGVSFASGTSRLASIEARGEARFSLSSPGGSKSIVRAAEALLAFGPDGEPERWSASGGVRAELEDGGVGRRILEGESADYAASARVLKVSGKPDRPAVADSSSFRVEAGAIASGPGDRDLEASGGVKCLLRPGDERRAAGFFAPAGPVFVSSKSLAIRDDGGTLVFSGDVRARQDEDFLLAGELEISEATQDMRARGGAAAGLIQAAAGESPGRRIEIGGGEMTFSAAGRVLSFLDKAYVQLPDARLGAETVDAVLVRKGRGVDSLTARRDVVISKGRYEGRGGAAFYQAQADRITLTGRPVLVDKEGGSWRGDKLTFDLGDGNIRIENEGQRRSTTVIKS